MQQNLTCNLEGWGNLNSRQENNLLTAIEHSHRVCSITLNLPHQQLEKVVKMMLKPFPMLTHLRMISFIANRSLRLPSEFLGGPTSSLQELDLSGISLLASPSILSSASDLVDLHLGKLPMTDHVSPEVMVTVLAVMTKLKSLTIEIHYHPMHPVNVKAQAILPALTQFKFQGSDRYLEDLVAQLDTPRLFDLTVMILNTCSLSGHSLQKFPQLFQFIDHAEDLKLSQFRCAYAEIHNFQSSIRFENTQTGHHPTFLTLGEVKSASERPQFKGQLQPIEALLSQASAIISSLQHLSITTLHRPIIRDKYWHHAGLLRLLRSFDTVETLHVGRPFPGRLVPMLNGLSKDLVAEVLPALRLLRFEDKLLKFVKKALAPFIKKRQLVGCPPLTIVKTHKDFERLQCLNETKGG